MAPNSSIAAYPYDIPLGYTEDDYYPGAMMDFLNEMQLTQFSNQFQALIDQAKQADNGQDGDFLMNEMRAAINTNPVSSGMYGDGAVVLIGHVFVSFEPAPYGGVKLYDWEGHAVLAYNIEPANPDNPDQGVVDVYDSNQPFVPAEDSDPQLHQSKANSSRLFINADGTWSFPGLGWSGRRSQIEIIPASTLINELKAGLTILEPGSPVFDPGPNTAIYAMTAPDGKQVNLATGGSQGVEVIPTYVTSPRPSTAASLTGPSGTYVEKLVGSDGLSENVETNAETYSVNAGAGAAQVSVATPTNTIAIGPAPGKAPPRAAAVAIDVETGNGGATSASLSGSPAATMSLEFNGGQAIVAAPRTAPRGSY